MQLEALFVVDVPDSSGAGVRAECRASGMLYELADEDWEEPIVGQPSAGAGNGDAVSGQDAWAAAGLSTPPRPRNPGESPELHVGKPFMSAPSPLKHLPPSEESAGPMLTLAAASAVTTGTVPSTPSRDRNNKPREMADVGSSNRQLSRPRMGGAPLPPPPRGFRFRPILPEGFEVVVSLALVSGRYYPRLLAHPMLRPIVRDMQGHANEAAARLDGHHLFALEGILPGFFNASEATRWKPGRTAMVKDAAAERGAGLARVWDVRRRQALEVVAPQLTDNVAAAAAVAAPAASVVDARAEVDQPQEGQHVGIQSLTHSPPVVGISTSADVQPAPPVPVQNVPAL